MTTLFDRLTDAAYDAITEVVAFLWLVRAGRHAD